MFLVFKGLGGIFSCLKQTFLDEAMKGYPCSNLRVIMFSAEVLYWMRLQTKKCVECICLHNHCLSPSCDIKCQPFDLSFTITYKTVVLLLELKRKVERSPSY